MMIVERRREELAWCRDFCREYWPEECAHILRLADEAVRQEFIFDLPWDMEQTQKAVVFKGEIDWQYMPDGDPEFIYQFNRHRYWICLGQAYAMTGEERYAECFAGQLLSWMKHNPITEETKKTTWRTIEAGIRGENWVKAMGYFRDSPSVTQEVRREFVRGLRLHGDYLYNCRVPFSDKSNWGVLESHGLYVIGMALERGELFGQWAGEAERASQPEDCRESNLQCPSPADYIREALTRLERELSIQVMDDGVQWEQSPMYHNEVLRCVLEVIRVARLCGAVLPQAIHQRAWAMAHADLAWMKPDRTQPCGGDSDRTDLRDVLTPAAWLLKDCELRSAGYGRLDFESAWDLGPEAAMEYEGMGSVPPRRRFHALEQSGNYCLRSGWEWEADYLHFKCGSLGGGHGHFDKLHLDLVLCGEDVLVDSGRYTYVDGDLRRALKSARAHNVPMVDGREYTRCTGSWDVAGTAPAIGQQWCRKGDFTFIQGSHLGYLESGVCVVRRIISLGTRIHVVVDGFYGRGTHTYSQVFHLNPRGSVTREGNSFRYCGERAQARFSVVTGQAELAVEERPISFHYNELEAAPEITVQKQSALPASLITVITGCGAGASANCAVSRVPVTVPVTGRTLGDEEAEAVRIEDGEHCWLVVVNHRETGSDGEYIGADGHYGLGRVMVCDELSGESGMTVLQW